MLHRCCPYKYFRVPVVTVHIVFDGGDQCRDVRKAAPANALVCDFAEPPFHQVQPGTRSRNEVLMEPWMPPEPGFHTGMLVGFIVVHDQMQVDLGRGFGVDLFEEADEFLMPMPRHAVADHLAIEHAEGRKQSGCAVAFTDQSLCSKRVQGPRILLLIHIFRSINSN